MAVDMGYEGFIRVGTSASGTSIVQNVTEWSLEAGGDALEITNFGSTYDREYTPGMRGWTATLSGNADDANEQAYLYKNFTATGGMYGTTSFFVEMIAGYAAGTTTKRGFKGKGTLTGFSHSATPDGLQTFTANVQGHSRLTTYAT